MLPIFWMSGGSSIDQSLFLVMVMTCQAFRTVIWGGVRRYLQPVWHYASLVLAMSNDMREDLLRLGCPDEKIRIHYHGINLEQFKYVERELAPPIRLLFVGSLSDRKGVEDVLRAFAQVAKQRTQVELRIVGDGLLRSKLEQLVRAWGLENRVSFAGLYPP